MIHIYVPLIPKASCRNEVRDDMREAGILKSHVTINKHSSFVSIGPNSLNYRSKGQVVTVLCRSAWYACSKGKIAPSSVSLTAIVLLSGCQVATDFEACLADSIIRNRPTRVLMVSRQWVCRDDAQSVKRFIETEHGLHVEMKEIG